MNRSRKEKLKENIERLDENEHAQIFAIIKKHTDNYTKTRNGAFISSDALADDCLVEIETLVAFYLDQRKGWNEHR
jgi:hypothetical protein